MSKKEQIESKKDDMMAPKSSSQSNGAGSDAQSGQKPPHGDRYKIRINKEEFVVEKPSMTGRELLLLAGKVPPENHLLIKKMHGGSVASVGLDDTVDLTDPGVERFTTLAKDQTEG